MLYVPILCAPRYVYLVRFLCTDYEVFFSSRSRSDNITGNRGRKLDIQFKSLISMYVLCVGGCEAGRIMNGEESRRAPIESFRRGGGWEGCSLFCVKRQRWKIFFIVLVSGWNGWGEFGFCIFDIESVNSKKKKKVEQGCPFPPHFSLTYY